MKNLRLIGLLSASLLVLPLWAGFKELRSRSQPILNYGNSQKVVNKKVAIKFVEENLPAGGGTWMYPSGFGLPLPGMTDHTSHEGESSLEVVLKADAYSGGAVCAASAIDLSHYTEKGMLELWIKGAVGGEVMSIGLMDNGVNSGGRPLQTWVNSRSYSSVRTDKWSLIQIPLLAMGNRGSYWSDEQNARLSFAFNWSGVTCFNVDIDKERHPSFKVWFDDVLIYKEGAPGDSEGEGGYPFANDDIIDFPEGGKP